MRFLLFAELCADLSCHVMSCHDADVTNNIYMSKMPRQIGSSPIGTDVGSAFHQASYLGSPVSYGCGGYN